MKFFRDILGYPGQSVIKASENTKSVVTAPTEYKSVVCDHSWTNLPDLYLESPLNISDYNKFLELIGHSKSTYGSLSILELRICNRCNKREIKSGFVNLYGPAKWTPTNKFLEKLLFSHMKITGLPAPKDFQDALDLRDGKFRDSGKTDTFGRFHCNDGPAVLRPNGIPEYWWHGVSIPSRWIENKNEITSSDFLEEQNVERRKALMEIIGTDKFVSVLQMTKVSDILRNNILYELFEKIDDVFGKIHLVRCTNPPKNSESDPSIYYLMTPPWISDVWESVAWTFYERAETYNPEVET